MRIIVNGQQAFGSAVLEALLEKGEDVVGVYTAPDKEGRKPDPLGELAQSSGLSVFQPPSFKNSEVVEQVKSLKPDLGVMAFVTLFVPEDVLTIPTHGTIQYHPSLLPHHRGPSAINWAIIKGRKRTGLSIFWPDNGLDTGPILLQKEVEITDDDTLGSVYFDKLFQLGVDALIEGVDLVRDGKAAKVVQDETQATYESWCNREAAEIDWSKPIGDVYNLIRGCNPAAGRLDDHRRQNVANLRRGQADGGRRHAGTGERTYRRGLHRRGGGRRYPGEKGQARGRRQDRGRRLRGRKRPHRRHVIRLNVQLRRHCLKGCVLPRSGLEISLSGPRRRKENAVSLPRGELLGNPARVFAAT